MRWLPGPETRAAVLKHPFVLAGFAVVVLLGLTASVLIVVDSARGGSDVPAVSVTPLTTTTTGPRAKTATAGGVTGTTNRVATVRSAPGSRLPALGTIDEGEELVIDGRTTDSKWYRVIFPPDSELHGWVDATAVDVTGDPATLAVTTPEPPVFVQVPTASASELTAIAARQTPTPDTSSTVTATPEDGGLPDLAIGTTPTLSNGKLFVTVENQGQGNATGDLVIAVFNADGTKLLAGATLPAFTLRAGRSIDISTGFEITTNVTLLLIVDPNGDIAETDDTNNRATVAIATGNPDESLTPLPFPPTATELPDETPEP